jgi:hypothetical protein
MTILPQTVIASADQARSNLVAHKKIASALRASQ